LFDLMGLAANERATDEARAIAAFKTHELQDWLKQQAADQPHAFFALQQIEQFEKDPKHMDLTPPVEPPDGPPIGAMGSLDCDWPDRR
jgi:hypothetical protein